jgi:hypothetical protein
MSMKERMPSEFGPRWEEIVVSKHKVYAGLSIDPDKRIVAAGYPDTGDSRDFWRNRHQFSSDEKLWERLWKVAPWLQRNLQQHFPDHVIGPATQIVMSEKTFIEDRWFFSYLFNSFNLPQGVDEEYARPILTRELESPNPRSTIWFARVTETVAVTDIDT